MGDLEPSAEVVVIITSMFAAPAVASFFFLRRFPTLAAWTIGIGVALAPIGWLAPDPSSPTAALAPLGFIAAFIAFESLREKPSLVGVYGLGHLGLMALYIPLMSAYPSWFARFWTVIATPDNLQDVQTLLVSSVLGWGLGSSGLFGFADTFVPTPLTGKPDPTHVPRVTMLVGVAAFVAVLLSKGGEYLGASTIPQSVSGIVTSVDYLYYVSLFASLFAMFSRGKIDLRVVSWLVVAFVLELISGSKGRFFLFVLAPAVTVYAMSRRRLSRRQLGGFVGVIVVSVFGIFPVLVNYRDDLASGHAEVTNAAEALQEASQRSDNDYVDRLLAPVTAANTAEQVIAITSIVNARLSLPPERLAIRVGFFWFPRAAWPDKPMALNTNEIGRISGRLGESDNHTAVLTTGPAEAYMYLGVGGGLLLLIPGLLMRFVERLVAPAPLADAFQAGFWLHITRFAASFITGDFEALLTGAIQQFAVLFLLLFLHRRAAEHTAAMVRDRGGGPQDRTAE